MSMSACRALPVVVIMLAAKSASAVDPFTYPLSPAERPKASQPLNLLSVWDPSLATGEFTTGFEVAVPPARNGLAPVFSITYRSNRRGTQLGKGWDLGVPVIRRTTRFGVPRYVGPGTRTPDEDTFEFEIGEHSGELVFVGEESGRLIYQPRREGFFAKFVWNPGDRAWKVLERSGRVFRLAERDENPAARSQIFAWYVSDIKDVFGNYVRYRYSAAHGALWLDSITYDLNARRQVQGAPRVRFTWGTSSAAQRVTYEKGYRTELDRRTLDRITVRAENERRTEVQTRTYELTHSLVAPGQPMITRIAPEGLPPTSFRYHAPAPGKLTREQVTSLGPAIPSLERVHETKLKGGAGRTRHYKTLSTLVDIDGDGDLDVLQVHGNSRRWARNNAGEIESSWNTVANPVGYTYALRYEQYWGSTEVLQDLLHVDADGKIDLVYYHSDEIHVCYGRGDGRFDCQHTIPAAVARNRFVGYLTSTTGVNMCQQVGFVDVNGDGLLDYIRNPDRRRPDYLLIYHNTGDGFSTTGRRLETPCIRQYVGLSTLHEKHLVSDLRDFNGDGIPDRALLSMLHSTDLTVAYGDGRGRFDTDNLKTFSNMRPLGRQYGVPLLTASSSREESGYYDVNGDGLIDLVYATDLGSGGHGLRVRLNTGGGFAAPADWSFALPKDCTRRPGMRVTYRSCPKCVSDPREAVEADTHTVQMLVDFDGDGQLDFLSLQGDPVSHGPATLCRKTRAPVPAYRLRRITHGAAGTTSIAYKPHQSALHPMPFRVWGLHRIGQRDDATGRLSEKDYLLQGPRYDVATREFRGFARVVVRDNARRIIEHRFRQDGWGFGKRTDLEIRTADGETLLKSVATSYDAPQVFSGAGGHRAWVRPKLLTTRYHYPGGNATTRTALYYFTDETRNRLGLLWKREQRGYTDVSNDTRRDVYEYSFTDGVDLRVVREKRVTREGAGAGMASQVHYLYDDECTGGAFSRGVLCERSVFRDAGVVAARYRYTFDALGRLRREDLPDGEHRVLTYHNGAAPTPHVRTATDALGHTTTLGDYHPLSGRARRVCGPRYAFNPGDKCDELAFDKYGRTTVRRLALDDGTGGYTAYAVESFAYADGAVPAHVTRVVNPDPVRGLEPLREGRTYFDVFGDVVLETRLLGQTWSRSHFTYDAHGNLDRVWSAVEQPSAGYTAPPRCPPDYTYTHDLLDRLTSIRHKNGDTSQALHDQKDVVVTDGEGRHTRFRITAHGQIGQKIQHDGKQPIVHRYRYDAAGRLTRAIGPDGARFRYTYYRDGSLVYASTPVGATLYTRTPGGKIEHITRGNGATVGYAYDAGGRISLRHTRPGSGCPEPVPERVFSYSYDADSRTLGLLSEVEGDRYAKVYSHDARGRLSGVYLEDTEGGQALSYTRELNAAGDTRRIGYPSGRWLEQRHDAAGNLTGFGDGQHLSGLATYKPNGRLESVHVELPGQRLTLSRQYGYDGKWRLDQIDSTVGGTTWNVGYGYERNDNLASYSDPSSALSYAWHYDGANRLVSADGYKGGPVCYTLARNGALQGATEAGVSWTYSHASALRQRLTRMSSSAGTHDFTHDAAGQRCTMSRPGGPARLYTWTGDGLLAAMGDGGETGFSTTFEYDHAGERWRRTADGLRTWYLDDLVELSDARGAVEYLPFPGGRCEVDETGKARCTLKDQINAVMMADAGGRVLSKNSFFPYGQRISLVSAASGPRPIDSFSPFGFNDKRKERKGDLIYYGARYYDPFTRQFISVDPVREAGADDTLGGNSLQPYVYAGANPTSYVDTDGQWLGHVLRVAVRLGRGGSAALRVAPRALTVGNLTRAASRARTGVRFAAGAGLAGWRSLSAWQKAFVLMDICDKSLDNVLPHNRAERWATEQIGAALGVLLAKGDDVDEEEDARRLNKQDRDNQNNERKKRDGKKRRSRKVKRGAAAADQYKELYRARTRDDRVINNMEKTKQNEMTQLNRIQDLEDSASWYDE